eukprot:EG_transcript_41054
MATTTQELHVARAPSAILQGGISDAGGSRVTLIHRASEGDDFDLYKKRQRAEQEQLRRYREANLRANNGRERQDLYDENWEGDVWKGSSFNILTVLIFVAVGAPVIGVAVAFFTYGVLWG